MRNGEYGSHRRGGGGGGGGGREGEEEVEQSRVWKSRAMGEKLLLNPRLHCLI